MLLAVDEVFGNREFEPDEVCGKAKGGLHVRTRDIAFDLHDLLLVDQDVQPRCLVWRQEIESPSAGDPIFTSVEIT
ncbi:hypothetical protein AA101099_2977 [Neoasaia chiangmaiensis NBRC 101099]|nr:hypothetical protein AA101099_2977 [Neoasaia chiangmaiensis NBRC 101099]GEN16202.1 hypothetical protein NCH01_26330 [Neoasaia chiangmaiensis]